MTAQTTANILKANFIGISAITRGRDTRDTSRHRGPVERPLKVAPAWRQRVGGKQSRSVGSSELWLPGLPVGGWLGDAGHAGMVDEEAADAGDGLGEGLVGGWFDIEAA